jgi:hypothetical protein
MANPIEQAARAIRTRLTQLQALISEQQQLRKALDTLEGLLEAKRGEATAAPTKRASGARPAQRAPAGTATPPAPRRRRGGSRADQFVALVAERPGITVAEAAERLKTSRDTLYNVTARLQREGRLRKEGRGFYPAEQEPSQEGPGDPPASAS